MSNPTGIPFNPRKFEKCQWCDSNADYENIKQDGTTFYTCDEHKIDPAGEYGGYSYHYGPICKRGFEHSPEELAAIEKHFRSFMSIGPAEDPRDKEEREYNLEHPKKTQRF